MRNVYEVVPLLASPGEWGHGWGHDGGWVWLWPLGMLFWVAVIGLVAWLVLRSVRTPRTSGLDAARDLLSQRYARGEISEEEYGERLTVLRSKHR